MAVYQKNRLADERLQSSVTPTDAVKHHTTIALVWGVQVRNGAETICDETWPDKNLETIRWRFDTETQQGTHESWGRNAKLPDVSANF